MEKEEEVNVEDVKVIADSKETPMGNGKRQGIVYSIDVIQKLGTYLSHRPWVEVNELLKELDKGTPLEY